MDMEVCTTTEKAALSILRRSYAILRVESSTAESIQSSWLAAKQFFGSTVLDDDDKHVAGGHDGDARRRIVNGALYGYNVPSDAKRLFRSICSDQAKEVQPWPDDLDRGHLRRSSIDAASRLHALLIDCLEELKAVAATTCSATDEMEESSFTVSDRTQRTVGSVGGDFDTGHRRKRQRTLLSPTAAVPAKSCNLFIPRSMNEAQYCPLDYFLYNNNRGRRNENCSEHVDRGILICVALTHVPGLEVFCRESNRYVCPELIAKGEALLGERCSGCSDLVCVMAGDQLKEALAKMSGGKGEDEHTCIGSMLMNTSACVHRVRNRLERARLSLTYELRGEPR